MAGAYPMRESCSAGPSYAAGAGAGICRTLPVVRYFFSNDSNKASSFWRLAAAAASFTC